MNPIATAEIASRNIEALAALPTRLRESVQDYGDRLDLNLIARAYRYSERAHAGQKRASGEEYIAHCVDVAKIVTDLHLDTTSIVAALVHDVVEDTLISLEDLDRKSTRLNSSHSQISYAVFCLKKKKKKTN